MTTYQQLASATMLLLAAFTTSPTVRAHGDSGDVWVTRQSTDHLFMVAEQRGVAVGDLRRLRDDGSERSKHRRRHVATDPPVGHQITLSRRPAVLLAR
jgi:hypothetical protein